jgi:hypothetical protein
MLFGVQSSDWFTNLEQIDISSINNDPEFFRELKLRYKKNRSWIKWIASPFRLRSCNFVKVRTYNYANDSRKNRPAKFEKFDIERILSQGKDLPEYSGVEQDYEYAPRPGTNPMIRPKIFAVSPDLRTEMQMVVIESVA